MRIEYQCLMTYYYIYLRGLENMRHRHLSHLPIHVRKVKDRL